MFAEINVQRLLREQNSKLFDGHIVFLHSGEKGHVAALLTLKAKWFATLTSNNANYDEQYCVTSRVAARSIVHKFLKRSPVWTKPERVLMSLL